MLPVKMTACMYANVTFFRLKDRWTAYCGHNSDEKLRAVGGGACIGHTERVRAVVSQRRVELILKLSSPDALPTHARACGVSCLDHEALQAAEDRRFWWAESCLDLLHRRPVQQPYFNDSVEYVVIVVAIPAVDTEVLHSFGASTMTKDKS